MQPGGSRQRASPQFTTRSPYRKGQTKRPPEGGLSGCAERAVPPPIMIPSHPWDLFYATLVGCWESKGLFHERNQTSVADMTHERRGPGDSLLVSFQLPPSPMSIFARGLKHPPNMAVEGSRYADAHVRHLSTSPTSVFVVRVREGVPRSPRALVSAPPHPQAVALDRNDTVVGRRAPLPWRACGGTRRVTCAWLRAVHWSFLAPNRRRRCLP
jgi:hypothetical protein